jgi:hypothetical protein
MDEASPIMRELIAESMKPGPPPYRIAPRIDPILMSTIALRYRLSPRELSVLCKMNATGTLKKVKPVVKIALKRLGLIEQESGTYPQIWKRTRLGDCVAGLGKRGAVPGKQA